MSQLITNIYVKFSFLSECFYAPYVTPVERKSFEHPHPFSLKLAFLTNQLFCVLLFSLLLSYFYNSATVYFSESFSVVIYDIPYPTISSSQARDYNLCILCFGGVYICRVCMCARQYISYFHS